MGLLSRQLPQCTNILIDQTSIRLICYNSGIGSGLSMFGNGVLGFCQMGYAAGGTRHFLGQFLSPSSILRF
jgi:hypothetical protein